jgi:hypothetical protein
VVAEVTTLFERLVSELSTGLAAVTVRQSPRAMATAIDVTPTNPTSANFGVFADEAQLYSFSFGPMSQWEFPWERRYRKGEKDELTEIEEMSRAVIAGRCELTRGPFWLTGKIYVGDYTYKMTDLPMLPIPPFWRRHYAPYVISPFLTSETWPFSINKSMSVIAWFRQLTTQL